MDNPFDLFHNRIIEAISGGDVVCLFFPRLGKTLILDLRSTVDIPPGVFIENMVSSARERLSSIQELRPEFDLPDEIRLAPWFGFVSSLHSSGVYDALIDRCWQTNHLATVNACEAAIDELGRIERRQARAIVRGEMSKTLWQRSEG
jgi:hypothetical protein